MSFTVHNTVGTHSGTHFILCLKPSISMYAEDCIRRHDSDKRDWLLLEHLQKLSKPLVHQIG